MTRTSGNLIRALRLRRRRVLNRLCSIKGARDVFDFQKFLATQIAYAESVIARAKADGNDALLEKSQRHWHMLKEYGDSLVWQLLHSHAIRQLRKNQQSVAPLHPQSEHLAFCLEVAKSFSYSGIPVLIADLTNELRVGDLIVAANPEAPTLVECKAGTYRAGRPLKGRAGRQLSRMAGAVRYLAEGKAKVHDEPLSRLTIESGLELSHAWAVIEEMGAELRDKGFSIRQIGEGQFLYMDSSRCGGWERIIVPDDVARNIGGYVATSACKSACLP